MGCVYKYFFVNTAGAYPPFFGSVTKSSFEGVITVIKYIFYSGCVSSGCSKSPGFKQSSSSSYFIIITFDQSNENRLRYQESTRFIKAPFYNLILGEKMMTKDWVEVWV